MDKKDGNPVSTAPGKKPRDYPTIEVKDHDQLVARLEEILARIDSDPELGRLLVINPILVLEDVGVTLSEQLRDHVQRTLGFPKGRVKRLYETRKRMKELFGAAGLTVPEAPKERADLVFDALKIAPRNDERPRALSVDEMRPYRKESPLVAALYEVGRLERGAIMFHSRGTYEEYKNGRVHHPWLTGISLRGQ